MGRLTVLSRPLLFSPLIDQRGQPLFAVCVCRLSSGFEKYPSNWGALNIGVLHPVFCPSSALYGEAVCSACLAPFFFLWALFLVFRILRGSRERLLDWLSCDESVL